MAAVVVVEVYVLKMNEEKVKTRKKSMMIREMETQ